MLDNLFKNRMSAYNLEVLKDCFIIGDRFMQVLLITQLPSQYQIGLLSRYTNDPDIQVSLCHYPIKESITDYLNKDFKDLEDKYNKTKDATEKAAINKDLQKLKIYIEQQTSLSDHTINVILTLSVKADTYEELKTRVSEVKSRMRTSGFKIASPSTMKLNLLKTVHPLWLDHGLQKDIYYGLGFPLSASSLAGLYPFVYSQLKDEKGFLFGSEYYNGGIILWDPFLYKNDHAEAKKHDRLTGNIVLVGKSGSGKTTDVSLIAMHAIREGRNLFWIDPENKNDRITKEFGGKFIPWGTKGSQINIFDLRKGSFDEDDQNEIDPWDTELAIYTAIDDFKMLLSLYKQGITEDLLDWVGPIIIELYADFGITFDVPFKNLPTEAYPTMSDFVKKLNDKINDLKQQVQTQDINIRLASLAALYTKIQSMVNEHKHFFDGHTQIKLDNHQQNILSFGTRSLIGKEQGLKDALNYLMFRFAWTLCLDESKESCFILDEAHEYILDGASAVQIALFYRRSRKYNNYTVLGTQETRDFGSKKVIVHGKAIFNNATYKVIKHLEEDSVQVLRELMTLNDQEANFIKRCGEGDGLFVCGDKHIPIHVVATDTELNWMERSREKV